MRKKEIQVQADLVIAGGGLAGVCTALQSARMGLKTVLVNNRPYFGGNASAELMIMIVGASGMQEFNLNARETGVIEELFLENQYRNIERNRYIWDGILLDKLMAEENLQLFPNTCIDEVQLGEDGGIQSLSGLQTTTEKRFCFCAPLFADDTGDGVVGFLAGAEFRYGCEAKEEFSERFAPEEADSGVLPSTAVFFAHDTGKPVAYRRPAFATDFTKTDVLKHRIIPPNSFHQFQWFYELDGNLDQIGEYEDILQHHRELVYGIWDYIKNSGNYPAENYAFTYISPIAGKRESRRLVGDYILTERDVTGQRDFEDAVAHGGWSIDLHALDGFYSREIINRHIYLKGIYQIPYRCCYSKDISNLFVEGRCMSLSHVALGSVRTMATLSAAGQAVAAAAALCKKYGIRPREVGRYMQELQQLLMKQDQYIVGKRYSDSENLAERAEIQVSSVKPLENLHRQCIYMAEHPLALSLPLEGRLHGLRLFAEAETAAQLSYRIYKAEKPENYNPEIEIFSGAVSLESSGEMREVFLPAELDLEPGHYFLELESAQPVAFAMSQYSFTGAVTLEKQPNSNPTQVDCRDGSVKGYLWKTLQPCLCFAAVCDTAVFSGENLNNGFTRPFRMTNIWHSRGKEEEWIRLRWETPQSLQKLVLYFDSNLNRFCRSADKDNVDLFHRMVKDYDVSYLDRAGQKRLLCSVRDNFQRVNDLEFAPVETDTLLVELLDTHGQEFFSVYEIRCY